MELRPQTLAERKAARRSSSISQNTSQSTASDLAASSIPAASSAPTPRPDNSAPTSSSSKVPIDRETILAIARQHGLDLAPTKKVWTKHSYTVTPESKDEFKRRCDTLGLKMQDALEEALTDWFKKTDPQYRAVLQAKR